MSDSSRHDWRESSTSTKSDPGDATSSATIATLRAEVTELRARLAASETERNALSNRQKDVMTLLACSSSDHLLHDLRNVLNERTLYRTLADMMDGQQQNP